MEKVYLICTYTDDKAAAIDDCPNIGIEYMGRCGGIIMKEDGTIIGNHTSSSFGWLKNDLLRKLDINHTYDIIDLIGSKDIPENIKNWLDVYYTPKQID